MSPGGLKVQRLEHTDNPDEEVKEGDKYIPEEGTHVMDNFAETND